MDEATALQVLQQLRTHQDLPGARLRQAGKGQQHVEFDLPGGTTLLWQVQGGAARGLLERNGTALSRTPEQAVPMTSSPERLAHLLAARTRGLLQQPQNQPRRRRPLRAYLTGRGGRDYPQPGPSRLLS